MPKFEPGSWVQLNGRKGVVRGLRNRSALVSWLGAPKATRHGVKMLRPAGPPSALVLEGTLDSLLHSPRSVETLLRAWLAANRIRLVYKNVHTLADIGVIAKALGRQRPAFVHISCHGEHTSDGRAYITLAPRARTRDRIMLTSPETTNAFRDAFGGLPLLFSACLLGRHRAEMARFKEQAELDCVAAFTREVYDAEAMMFELLLYHGVLINGWAFATAVERARKALHTVGVRGSRGPHQAFVRLFR